MIAGGPFCAASDSMAPTSSGEYTAGYRYVQDPEDSPSVPLSEVCVWVITEQRFGAAGVVYFQVVVRRPAIFYLRVLRSNDGMFTDDAGGFAFVYDCACRSS